MDAKELKCYGCLDSKGKVCQINSSQYNDWAVMYKMDLESYISGDAGRFNVRRHYSDPDSSYVKGKDHSFFYDLETFLNKREKEMSNRLQGSLKYRFTEDEGIEVCGIDSKGKTMQPFYLRSDQLGFSAPVNQKYYPYDLYIEKHESKDKAIEQVIKWISMSRTIGGSFLWPTPFYCNYNKQRGGKITSDSQFYIQDRADLTLWEIKNWYDGKGEKDILERCREINIEHWLGHFGSFETYITYFMFDKFVSSDGLCNPLNIITGESDAPVRGPKGENPEPVITVSMKFAALEKMLNSLNDKIKERSINMTEIIVGKK